MQFEKRRSNAGIVLWGDIYELKALYQFIFDIQEKSHLIGDTDQSPLYNLLHEIRQAHDRESRKSTRDWFGEDETPIYGFDWFWTDVIWQTGLIRAAMAHMPLNRNHQAIMYALEDIVASSLEVLLPGTSNAFLEAGLRIGVSGPSSIFQRGGSRTHYFLELTPAKRKAQLWMLINSLDPVWSHLNKDNMPDFEKYEDCDFYPEFKW